MRSILLGCLLASVASGGAQHPSAFRYRRTVELSAAAAASAGAANACAVLDARVFLHADPTLSDLRLFSAGREVPYALTLSRTGLASDAARVLDVRISSPGHLAFDLAMPARPYSAVDLDLRATDFLASAHVTGLRAPGDPHPVYLATASLFDLSARDLGRSTTLQLPESTFPLLHLELDVSAAPGAVTPTIAPAFIAGANVPPTREAQTLYTPIVALDNMVQDGQRTVARMTMPAHVPLERITFELDPADRGNFSRTVEISARTLMAQGSRNSEPSAPEQSTGTISRVRLPAGGQAGGPGIDEQSLSVPFILGANAKAPAVVDLAIDNRGAPPLKLAKIWLEMRQRRICFPLGAVTQPPVLLYGAPPAAPPTYDFGRSFDPARPVRSAELGGEELNPAWHPSAVQRASPLWQRPQIRWAAFLLALSLACVGALRLGRRMRV